MRRPPSSEREGRGVVEARVYEATEGLIADGLSALSLDRVAEAASVTTAQLGERYANVEALVFSSAVRLAREPVIDPPHPTTAGSDSVADTAERLARAHRRYIAERPSRFAALHELGGAALFAFPSLRQSLVDRNRRTREAVLAHLEAAWDVEESADLADVASVVVGAFNGIELCFLDDANVAARDDAYRGAVAAVVQRLTQA